MTDTPTMSIHKENDFRETFICLLKFIKDNPLASEKDVKLLLSNRKTKEPTDAE